MIKALDQIASDVPVSSTTDRAAVLELAKIEAIRLLRHPVVLCAFLVLAVAWVLPELLGDPTDAYPIMREVSQSVQFLTASLLGGAALIASHLAVIRDAYYRSEALVSVLALAPWQRLLAHLLALVPLTLITWLLVLVRVAVVSANPNAAGSVAFHEQAVGPVAVLLLGAVGVLLGRLTTLLVVGPLVMVLLAVATLASAFFAPTNGLRPQALLPVTYDEIFELPIPAMLADRRDDWHLLYLLTATVLIGMVAIIVSGYRALWLKLSAVLAAVAVGAVAWIQVLPIDRSLTAARNIATKEPSSQQVCERRSAVTYCAWPEFAPWIDSWEGITRGVLARVPDDVAARPLAVRQRVNATNPLGLGMSIMSTAPVASWSRDDERAGTPDAVVAETAWGNPEQEFGFAARLAHAVVSGEPPAEDIVSVCGSQALITLWLAVGVNESTAAGLDQRRQQGSVFLTVAGFGAGLAFTHQAIALLQALLELPADTAQDKIHASWDHLVDPSTTLPQAAETLGIPVARVPSPTGDSRCQETETE